MFAAPTLHLWLHESPFTVPAPMLSCLTDAEHAQALRFHRPEDRMQRLAATAYKRVLLGQALACDPAGLRFSAHPQGKPYILSGGAGASALPEFNVSHTDGAIAIAVGATAVGVDIEHVGGCEFDWNVAPLCFNKGERAAIAAAGASQRSIHAYALWTRKEALLKATGQGLEVSPLEVDSGVAAGGGPFGTQLIGFGGRHWRVETQGIHGKWIASVALLAEAGPARWHFGAPGLPSVVA